MPITTVLGDANARNWYDTASLFHHLIVLISIQHRSGLIIFTWTERTPASLTKTLLRSTTAISRTASIPRYVRP
ncbi:unnamed protein product [Hydatigera taeniaeformis]|uniref:Transposase n=1 Tax=Hydatigena taeniaeformis TaxID=6205 RepID=A0A0R3WZ23_HYDTA|nr:unnamed protein product [Hydatigera taeniaeformis]